MSRQTDLSGKVVAVTGGARGIGAATARALRRAGAAVVIGDLDTELATKVAAEIGGVALPLDVADRDSFAGFLDQVIERQGRLDGLVNNAGFMVIGRAQQVPVERQLAQLEVNLRGVVLGCNEATSRMRRGAVIVNIASLAGRIPMMGGAVYSATKAAVLSYTEALDAELAEQGIRAVSVLPTFTDTELIAGTSAGGMLKPISPESVADAVVASLAHPRPVRVVPPALAGGSLLWPMTPRRIKPWLRARMGLDTVFTEPDERARAEYVARTGG